MKTGEGSDNYKLFKALQKQKGRLGDIQLSDKIWRKEFSQMNQKSFANLLSRVTLWFEEWLVFYDAQKQPDQQMVRLVEAYNKRGLFELADQVYNKALKQIDDDESLQRDHNLVALHKAQYYSDNPIKIAKGAALLEDVAHSYFQWHSKQSAIFTAELYNWGDIQHVEFKKEKEIFSQITLNEKLSPAYQLVVKLVSKKEPRYLLQLIKEIESGKIKEGTQTYVILLNYCLAYYMRLCSQGKIDDPKQLMKLYETGMKTGAFCSNGKLPEKRFHNIVNAISTCVPKDQCDQFIDRWANFVNSNDPESSKKIALAFACLNYEEYSEIISLLRGLTYEELITKLSTNALLNIAFLEEGQEYYDSLLNQLFNYKRQVKRNRSNISNKLFHAHLNLCDFIEKIATPNKSLHKSIDLADYSYLMFRTWAKRKLKLLQT